MTSFQSLLIINNTSLGAITFIRNRCYSHITFFTTQVSESLIGQSTVHRPVVYKSFLCKILHLLRSPYIFMTNRKLSKMKLGLHIAHTESSTNVKKYFNNTKISLLQNKTEFTRKSHIHSLCHKTNCIFKITFFLTVTVRSLNEGARNWVYFNNKQHTFFSYVSVLFILHIQNSFITHAFAITVSISKKSVRYKLAQALLLPTSIKGIS